MPKIQRETEEVRIRVSTVGSLIRDYRNRRDVSQLQLAKLLGYSSSQFVSNWERGQSSPPFSVLPKLVKILEIPSNRLLNVIMKCQNDLFHLRQREMHQVFANYKRK